MTKEVADYALVVGNPAKQAGWVCQCAEELRVKNKIARCNKCGREYRLKNKRLEYYKDGRYKDTAG